MSSNRSPDRCWDNQKFISRCTNGKEQDSSVVTNFQHAMFRRFSLRQCFPAIPSYAYAKSLLDLLATSRRWWSWSELLSWECRAEYQTHWYDCPHLYDWSMVTHDDDTPPTKLNWVVALHGEQKMLTLWLAFFVFFPKMHMQTWVMFISKLTKQRIHCSDAL